jgi:glycosyltransferase involved in cell wall biosynthesis
MNVTVLSEVRFSRAPDNSVWADAAPYESWARYLDEFDGVTIVGREQLHATPRHSMTRVDGPGVELRGVPHYIGWKQFLWKWREVRKPLQMVIRRPGAIILRLGSLLALVIQRPLLKSRRPYGVEVVGDPWDTFSSGAVDIPMRSVVRHVLSRSQRRLCTEAAGAAYVTEKFLQSRYPCLRRQWAASDVSVDELGTFTTHYSSIELTPADFRMKPRVFEPRGLLKVVTVGSLAQRYKGVDVLIRALERMAVLGHRCELTVIGDGRYLGELKALARTLKVVVRFRSHLLRHEVMGELDRADVFVLASRTEGLPRALIEAMARGLPCIATRVGGIPELLDDRVLCAPGSAESLADRICALVTGRLDPSEHSLRNFRRAKDFREELLRPRRREFYRWIRLATEQWAAGSTLR